MTRPSEEDPFPPSEFDQWAASYDDDVAGGGFPFTGYQRVLEEVVRLAEAGPDMDILDLGAGTGNLAERFAAFGCRLWCTDFSAAMLAAARVKLPGARFFLHDLRRPLPPELLRRFDRVVSAYVFHHFSLPEKVRIVDWLVCEHLSPGGRLVIADLSFPTGQSLDEARRKAGDQWDEEPYWVAAEALPALKAIDPSAAYVQVSDCAGVYLLSKPR